MSERDNRDMVERVQQAIAKALGFEEGTGSAARAAIEAMREPTSNMVRCGMSAFIGYDPDHDPLSITLPEAWAEMIDAALNTSKHE